MTSKIKWNDTGSAILIATLGTEPQVVTSVYDLLEARGMVIDLVQVVHTSAGSTGVDQAVECLQRDFTTYPYRHPFEFEFVPIHSHGIPITDVQTPSAGQAAFQTLYGLVRAAKLEERLVHLSIAGGRKNLALYGMVAAQMLFDESDCLWHLYSSGEFLAGRQLHPQTDDEVNLVQLPVLLRSFISPAFTDLRSVENVAEAVDQLRRLDLERRLREARAFVFGSLTPAERRTVGLLVREGLSDQEIASRLSLSPRTIEQQLRSAYSKAADYWEMDNITRSQLVALLNFYFSFSTAYEK